MADALFESVKFLLDAAVGLVDQSADAHQINVHGNAHISSGEVLFSNAGVDWLDIPNAGFDVGTDDFCLEMDVRFNSTATKEYLFTNAPGVPSKTIELYLETNTLKLAINAVVVATSSAVGTSSNVGVIVDRSAGVTRIFKDGTQFGGNIADVNVYDGSGAYRIGADNAGLNTLKGIIDVIRLTGASRHTANFSWSSPPTFDAFLSTITGSLTDPDGLPASYPVRAYRRSDGRLMADTFSDGGTGAYTIPVKQQFEELTIVAFYGPAGPPIYDDICIRVLPP